MCDWYWAGWLIEQKKVVSGLQLLTKCQQMFYQLSKDFAFLLSFTVNIST